MVMILYSLNELIFQPKQIISVCDCASNSDWQAVNEIFDIIHACRMLRCLSLIVNRQNAHECAPKASASFHGLGRAAEVDLVRCLQIVAHSLASALKVLLRIAVLVDADLKLLDGAIELGYGRLRIKVTHKDYRAY